MPLKRWQKKRKKKAFQKLVTIEKPKPLKKNVTYKFFKGFTISQKKTFVKGFKEKGLYPKKFLWEIKNHVKRNKNVAFYRHL